MAIGYAIGRAEPTSLNITTFGTGKYADEKIKAAVLRVFDLKPHAIIEVLDLKQPVYAQTATGGHFGKEYLMWEQLNQTEELLAAMN